MSDDSSIIEAYLRDIGETASRLPIREIERLVHLLDEARTRGKHVYLFGNGGSAATASHLAVDLSKGTIGPQKPPLRATALTDNMAVVSAWANDASYDDVFARQIECHVQPGDVVVGISSRGRSPNVLRGLRLARSRGAMTVGLTGFDGGEINGLVDLCIQVPSSCMEQVEDSHLMVGHILTRCLRDHQVRGQC